MNIFSGASVFSCFMNKKISSKFSFYNLTDVFGGKFGDYFLKFYEQIISGVWSILFLLPVENLVYHILSIKRSENYFTGNFMILFSIFTIFYIFSAAFLPKIRQVKIEKSLKKCLFDLDIDLEHKSNLTRKIVDELSPKGLFTKEGSFGFFVSTLLNLSAAASYFSIEHFISYVNSGNNGIVSLSFLGFLFFFWFVGKYFEKKYEFKFSSGSFAENKNSRFNLAESLVDIFNGGSDYTINKQKDKCRFNTILDLIEAHFSSSKNNSNV